MASGVPTRRVTRRADENAPPAIATRSRSTAALPSTKPALAGGVAATSKIPVLKRTHSAVAPSTSATSTGVSAKATTTATRRTALSENHVGKEKTSATRVEGKGKPSKTGAEVAERKPLASTAPTQGGMTRRARPPLATASSTLGAGVREEKDKPALKRKNTATVASSHASSSQPLPTASTKNGASPKVHVPARSRSTTASTSVSASETHLRERSLNADAGASTSTRSGSTTARASTSDGRVEVEVTETEPARKKRKTSSPVPVAEDVRSAEEGVFAGGKEVVLSSGGRGTAVRSPKASRPKDYGWTDLDAEDEGDPSMVSEYVIDAFKYMVAIEPQTMADPDYMSRQTAIDWEMRTILLEWLIEVHSKFRLLPETLFIAINLVDRFLAVRVVSLEKLQLVGLTAMFIAAKYEEVICPSINHFLHMTDESFELDEMLRAERYMLSTLQFDMSYPNPLNFLRRVSKADDYDIQTRTVAKFLIEIVAVKHELIGVQPSRLAAAAVWLARLCMERGDWTPNLVHYSGYAEAELLGPAQIMLDYLLDPNLNVDSVFYRKYATKKHMKASVYMRTWAMDKWHTTVEGTNPDAGNELEAMILAECA